MADLKINAKYYETGDYVLCKVYIYNDLDEKKPGLLHNLKLSLLTHNKELTYCNVYPENINYNENNYTILFNKPLNITNLEVKGEATLLDSTEIDYTTNVLTVPHRDSSFSENQGLFPQEHPEKTISSIYGVKEQTIQDQEFETSIMDSAIKLHMCEINFLEKDAYWISGNKPVDYQGGGNRLLNSFNNEIALKYQNINIFPPTLQAKTAIEPEAINYAINASLEDLTDWEITGSKSSLDIFYKLDNYHSDINALYIKVTAIDPYDGNEVHAKIESPKFSISATETVTSSLLTKLIPQNTDTKINNVDFTVKYYDNTETLISSTVNNYDTNTLLNNWSMLHNTEELPAGTEYISLEYKIYSIEGSDSIVFYILLPQVEENSTFTTRIPTNDTILKRESDLLSIPTYKNINTNSGSFILEFYPLYSSSGTKFIFDCLSEDDNNGIRGYFDADNYLNLDIYNLGSITALKTDNPVSLSLYEKHSIRFYWNSDKYGIEVDDTVIKEIETILALPDSVNPITYIGCNKIGTQQLMGDISYVLTWRDTDD